MKQVVTYAFACSLFLLGCDASEVLQGEGADALGSCFIDSNNHLLDQGVGLPEFQNSCAGLPAFNYAYARYDFFPTQPIVDYPGKFTVTANNNQSARSNHVLRSYDYNTYQWETLVDVTVGPPGSGSKQQYIVDFEYDSGKYYYFDVDYIGTPTSGQDFADIYVSFGYP